MPRRSDCLTRSGFDRRKLPVSSNPRAEHAPTRFKPPAALIEGLEVMREARDEPGLGGPHDVSLHAECLVSCPSGGSAPGRHSLRNGPTIVFVRGKVTSKARSPP